jgi:hypothetical protein
MLAFSLTYFVGRKDIMRDHDKYSDRYSAVSIATMLRAGRLRNFVLIPSSGKTIFLLYKVLRPVLGPT